VKEDSHAIDAQEEFNATSTPIVLLKEKLFSFQSKGFFMQSVQA